MSEIRNEPLTPDEFLEHYGVKGMKWGVKKNRVSNDGINAARIRTAGRVRELNRQADKLNLSTGSAAKKEAKKFSEMEMEFLRNPDRATALRLTTGEKVGLTVLAVALPGLGTASAAGTVAGRVAIRKVTERSVRKANE